MVRNAEMSPSARVLMVVGGGYVKPATTQFELLWDLKRTFGSNLTICLLSYALAPEAQYPIQLQQAVGILKYLHNARANRLENVIRPKS